MANIYDMADTWNNGATTFTAIKMDVTDTASAAASLLMDLQIGSASNFLVGKNLLEKKNGTNAQTFNLYNTYTDASNYERGFLKWDSNILKIGTEAAGTGTARALYLQSDDSTRVFRGATEMLRSDANGVKVAVRLAGLTSGSIDLGAPTISWRDIYLRPSASLTPSANGDLCIEATANDTLTFKLKGSDGTVRSGTVALA